MTKEEQLIENLEQMVSLQTRIIEIQKKELADRDNIIAKYDALHKLAKEIEGKRKGIFDILRRATGE